jgi:hypothetical protein
MSAPSCVIAIVAGLVVRSNLQDTQVRAWSRTAHVSRALSRRVVLRPCRLSLRRVTGPQKGTLVENKIKKKTYGARSREGRGDAARASARTRQDGGMSASSCVIAVVAVGSGAWWALEGEGGHVASARRVER